MSLSPLQEQPAFLKNPFYLLDTTVHFWCTFFSNSCELMKKKTKKLIYQPSVVCKEPLVEGTDAAGPVRPEPSPMGAAQPPSGLTQHGYTFFSSSQTSKFPKNLTVCSATRVKSVFHSCIE